MKCPCPDIEAYGSFGRRVHSRASAERHPISGTITLTARCNLECVHCYIRRPAGDRDSIDREVDASRLIELIDKIAEAGCLWLLFTGGEPLIRPDFLDIYTYAKRRGLLVTIFTNGTLVTPEVADHLERWRPFRVEITLYGYSRETYERVTGIPGSHERCLRGISLLRERGVPIRLKTMLLSLNRHELRRMQRFATEELDLPFHYDAMVSPRLTRSREPIAVRLGPEQVIALDLEDPRRREEWRRFAGKFNGRAHGSGKREELFHCGGGISAFTIDEAGGLGICGFYPEKALDLRTGSFRDGWERQLAEMRRKRITRRTRCVECGIKAICGMCPASAWLENGDPETPVDFLCRVAHLRAYALGFPVPQHGDCLYCRGGEGYRDLLRALEGLAGSAEYSIMKTEPVTSQTGEKKFVAVQKSNGL